MGVGSFKVRLFFVLYILTLGVLAIGRFSPETQAVLRAMGLRSAFGMLGYMLAGALVAYTFLWFKGREYGPHGRGAQGLTPEEIEIRKSLQYPRLRVTEESPAGQSRSPDSHENHV